MPIALGLLSSRVSLRLAVRFIPECDWLSGAWRGLRQPSHVDTSIRVLAFALKRSRHLRHLPGRSVMLPASECAEERALRERYKAALNAYREQVTAMSGLPTDAVFEDAYERAEAERVLFSHHRVCGRLRSRSNLDRANQRQYVWHQPRKNDGRTPGDERP